MSKNPQELTEPVVHRGKTEYQRPQYKQWFKKFSKERTAGAYHYLESLRKPTLLTQLRDILQYIETLEETNEMIVQDNKFLRQEVRNLKADLYSLDGDKNMEISKRLNANKNEAYHRKKSDQLRKSLYRANRVNKKLYTMLDAIGKELTSLRLMGQIWEKY